MATQLIKFQGNVYQILPSIKTAEVHPDVEYAVDDAGGNQQIFQSFDSACGLAVSVAASDGNPVNLDTLVYSEDGALAVGGDAGLEQYMEDPDASVFERLVITANSAGRVP